MPKKVNKKHAAIGALVTLLVGAAIAVVANAGRVCATVKNPTGRAICETFVATAKESLEVVADPVDAGVTVDGGL